MKGEDKAQKMPSSATSMTVPMKMSYKSAYAKAE